ncbi:MAG: hypothetical protein LBC70_09730 [Chitinispirillales bacterium]|jgi:hypothetical protein|nr:hypothetical protein [Chitinispirillales bacterium]
MKSSIIVKMCVVTATAVFLSLMSAGCGDRSRERADNDAAQPAPLSEPEPEQEQIADAKFNIYGTWEYVATPSSPEEWSEVPPTITIGTNNTLSLAIWERYYTGIMSKTDTHIRVHSLSGWADGEEFTTNEKEWTLTYNPETDLIRIVCGSWHTGYYRRASDLDADESIGGTYKFEQNLEGGFFGTVLVHPLTDRTALFFLDIGFNHNSGRLFGQMTIAGNTGTYSLDGCILKFKFTPRQLEIITEDGYGECGFGGNVHADNIYKLIDNTIPEYYLDAEDNKVLFADEARSVDFNE